MIYYELFIADEELMGRRRTSSSIITGLQMVANHCRDCRGVLGWKYERAYKESQKYKEGKFIFEKAKIVQENW